MNVVATPATRNLARQIILETKWDGSDAALRHLPLVHPSQSAALVVLLAQAAAEAVPNSETHKRGGALLLCEVERRLAHRRYAAGERDAATINGEREYQRERARVRRGRIA